MDKQKPTHTYLAGLERNRRRSFGLMEGGKGKSDLELHDVARGHNREHLVRGMWEKKKTGHESVG